MYTINAVCTVETLRSVNTVSNVKTVYTVTTVKTVYTYYTVIAVNTVNTVKTVYIVITVNLLNSFSLKDVHFQNNNSKTKIQTFSAKQVDWKLQHSFLLRFFFKKVASELRFSEAEHYSVKLKCKTSYLINLVKTDLIE